jgi:asparagine synthase (glutamine-hydrolysing)
MCGFAAFFSPGNRWPADFLAAVECDLHHRGPDSGGTVNESGFALVFRRLAIIDPDTRADQPMHDEKMRCTLVFNGEIYNHKALRAELEALGDVFRTESDTEVILRGYLRWGDRVLDRLEGMYAFALVDRVRGKALVARDPFGIKPLYLTVAKNIVAFASEMRCLTRITAPEIDEAALAELLTFGWAAGSLSNLKGIERVPGGTSLTIDLTNGKIVRRRFFDVVGLLAEPHDMALSDVLECIADGLKASVSDHLMSDVGYALQLSGGVDSSIVAAIACSSAGRRISSFAVDIGNHPMNERTWRDEVIARYDLDHHELPLGGREFADAFESSVWHMEGPVPHLACVMIRMMCRSVRPHTRVVLTGEGADEMFGGYERYALWRKLRLQSQLSRLLPVSLVPDRSPFRGIRRLSGLDGPAYASLYGDFKALHRIFPGLTPGPGQREATSRAARSFVDRMFAVDQGAYLESLLVRQDKMAMAESVEARVPFVHLPLARLLARVPRSVIVPGGMTKPLLKRIGERYLPHDLLYRRKNGLLLPYMEWLRDKEGLGRFLDYLEEPGCRLAGYGDRSALRQAADKARRGVVDEQSIHAMMLVNLELWLRAYGNLTSGPVGASRQVALVES